jgi:hypothetical protein
LELYLKGMRIYSAWPINTRFEKTIVFPNSQPIPVFYAETAPSSGPPNIDLLNSLNVTRAFSLCFAHSSSLISGGGSWGGG